MVTVRNAFHMPQRLSNGHNMQKSQSEAIEIKMLFKTSSLLTLTEE